MFKLRRIVIMAVAALAAALTAGLGLYGFTRYLKKVGTRGVVRGLGTVMYTAGVTIRTLAAEPPSVAVAPAK